MSNFDNLVAKVEEQDSVAASVETLLAIITERLRLVQPTEAGIEKYAAKIDRNAARIAAAVAGKAMARAG